MDILKTETYDYNLPPELIAQYPLEPRDSSKLLLYDAINDKINHKKFYNICDYLKSGDVLVINNTKVIPARLLGKKIDTNASVEIFLLKRINLTDWEVLSKPAKRLKLGAKVSFSDNLSCEIIQELDDGMRIIRFSFLGVFEDEINKVGLVPLPHYIHQENYKDLQRYNTVYSKFDGSSAAPTAGLHFTPELLLKIKSMGVEIVEVLLHVGLGTFRPVKTDNILEHKMHAEYIEVSQNSADIINNVKKNGGRVIAVGTTSIRTLESATDENGNVVATHKETNIFIYPGYKFKVVDAIITNFHLPKSSLIMLISAYLGVEKTMEIYNTAVNEKYRFFSFGDSMFLHNK